jgi:hypothetical protein
MALVGKGRGSGRRLRTIERAATELGVLASVPEAGCSECSLSPSISRSDSLLYRAASPGSLWAAMAFYIWRCILCRSCSRQLGVPVSSASRWFGARPRRIRAAIDSADQVPRFEGWPLIGQLSWNSVDDSLAAGHARSRLGLVQSQLLDLWFTLPHSEPCCCNKK